MRIQPLSTARYDALLATEPGTTRRTSRPEAEDTELRAAFNDFVGQTFYAQMLSAMRKTVGKPAYLHGGRMEEAFQNQLDQVLAEKLSDATEDTFSEPMYQLFTLPRR